MSRAGNAVELMQIIGPNSQFNQSLAQFHEHIGGVVDPPQQHRLIERQHSRLCQSSQSRRAVTDQFARMIRMDDNDRCQPRRRQKVEPLPGDSIRQHDRQPSMPSQPTQMFDLFESSHDDSQAFVGQHQRIAAAEQHLVDRFILFESRKGRLPIIEPLRLLRVRIMPAKAVAAMDGTSAGQHEQRSARVLV